MPSLDYNRIVNLSNEIQSILASAGGQWGIYAKNLVTDKVIFELNPDQAFASASVGKLPIALYVFSQVDKGQARLSDRLELKEEFVLGGSGVFKYMDMGLNPTLLDVITLMLVVSDNTCAKMLVKTFTPQRINEYLESVDFKTTSLKIDGDKFGFGMTTPREISNLYEGLYKNTYFSKELSEKFLEILKHGDSDNRIRRYLPHDRYKEEMRLEIASKAGSIPGVRSDTGIVFEKEPYTTCVLGMDIPDESYNVDNPGVLAIAKVSKIIYDQVTAQ